MTALTRRTFLGSLAAALAVPAALFARGPVESARTGVVLDMLYAWRENVHYPKDKPTAWVLGTDAFRAVKRECPEMAWYRFTNVELEHGVFRGIPAIHDPGFPRNAVALIGPGARVIPV